MELRLTPEQEADLARIAQHMGKDTEQLLTDTALEIFEQHARHNAIIEDRLKQADRGEFIDEDEMDRRFERMMRS